MVYLLLIIGLVLIYFSLKFNKPSANKNSFSSLLQNNLESNELQTITQQLKDFSDRIDNIEASLVLIHDELHGNINEGIYEVDDSSNTLEQNTEELKTILEIDNLPSIESDPLLDEKRTLNDTLYQLFDEGKTIDDISSITRIGKGEILLRLGLRKQES